MALDSTGVSASDFHLAADRRGGGASVSAETVGSATEQTNRRDSIVGTTRKSSRDSGVQVESGPAPVEVSDGGPPPTRDGDGVVIPSVATVTAGAEKDLQIQEGSDSSNAHPNNREHAAKQPLPSIESNNSPSIDVAAAAKSGATTSAAAPNDGKPNDSTQGQNVGEEVGSIVDDEGPLDTDATAVEEAGEGVSHVATEGKRHSADGGEHDPRLGITESGIQEVWEKEPDGSTLMGWKEHQDASSTDTKERREQGDREEELERRMEKTRDDGGNDYSKRTTTQTEWSSSPKINTTNAAVAAVEDANVKRGGRDRYESLDGEALLGKLLDDTAPSAMFEDDHQKLLQKVMRVRDDEHVSGRASCRDDSSPLRGIEQK